MSYDIDKDLPHESYSELSAPPLSPPGQGVVLVVVLVPMKETPHRSLVGMGVN